MSNNNLRARPLSSRQGDAIEAHVTIVFAALTVARVIRQRTGLRSAASPEALLAHFTTRRANNGGTEAMGRIIELHRHLAHGLYELSGGMQRRCQIARVLTTDPDTVLMDEPLGVLDATAMATTTASACFSSAEGSCGDPYQIGEESVRA